MSDTTAPSTVSAPLPQLVLELKELVVDYVKQETVVPLRQLGRYLTFGVVGAFLLGTGVIFLGVGGLRALQSETGATFTGDWSWAPYGIVVVTMVLGGVLTWKTRRGWRNRLEPR